MKWSLRVVSSLLFAAVSLCVNKAECLDLTGTWSGIQICPGDTENICPFLSQTVNAEGALAEFNLFIKQDGDTIKAFSDFFVQHYNGLVIDNGCCRGFSLVDCTTNPKDLENLSRIGEIAVLTMLDDDHFVGTSTVTGNFESTDPSINIGKYTEICTYSYRRVSNEIPDEIVECCCGLAAEECPAEPTTEATCSTTSSTSSCPEQVKKSFKNKKPLPKQKVKIRR